MEQQLLNQIRRRFYETGERERLVQLLKQRLTECGWREEVKRMCREAIRTRGLENITMDELTAQVTSECRSLLPDSVKKELIDQMKTFIDLQNDLF